MKHYGNFNDVLDKDGYLSRANLADSTFAHIRPGDYVCASYGVRDEDGYYYRGCVFGKVISVSMPKPFFGTAGGILAELTDGSRVEFLRYDVGKWNRSQRGYHPTGQVGKYFNNVCFPEPVSGSSHRSSVVAYLSDSRAALKDAMTAEWERRKRRQEQQKCEAQREAQARAAAAQAARQRAAEEARRNATVSDKELDNLFRGRK